MTRRSKPPVDDSELPDNLAESIMQRTLRHLWHEMDRLEGLPEGALEMGKVAKLALEINGEMRKAEKLEMNAAKALDHSQVLSWARQQTPELRARVVKELVAIDNPNRRSVLG